MKNVVILAIAVLMLARPLWPIAEYVMNYDYIANVLCENKDKPILQCDGKCYLAEMLAKETQQNDENPFGEEQAQTELLYVYDYSQALNNTHTLASISIQNNYSPTDELVSHLLICDISEPPES